jgi:hypothetical protein
MEISDSHPLVRTNALEMTGIRTWIIRKSTPHFLYVQILLRARQ